MILVINSQGRCGRRTESDVRYRIKHEALIYSLLYSSRHLENSVTGMCVLEAVGNVVGLLLFSGAFPLVERRYLERVDIAIPVRCVRFYCSKSVK